MEELCERFCAELGVNEIQKGHIIACVRDQMSTGDAKRIPWSSDEVTLLETLMVGRRHLNVTIIKKFTDKYPERMDGAVRAKWTKIYRKQSVGLKSEKVGNHPQYPWDWS